MHILNTLSPVFLIIALGAVLRRAGFVSSEFVKGISRLTYWIGLPCLLFYKVATASYDYRIAGKTFIVVLTGMSACIVIGYLAALLLRTGGNSIGAFVQGAFRGNLAYVGLPVVIYSFSDSSGIEAAKMQAIAIIVLALMTILYNIAAVTILLAGQHKFDRQVPGKIIRPIITNPLLLACVAGVIYSLTFSGLPTAVGRTFGAVGQIALPLALLSIGSTLVERKVTGQLTSAFAASAIKIAVAPVIGYLITCLISLGPGETRIALIFLACPTAISSYVLSEQLGGDEQLSATIVVISSLLAVLSLSFVIGLF